MWSHSIEVQIIGRLNRRPQTRQVKVFKFICLGTPDEYMVRQAVFKGTMLDLLAKGFGKSSVSSTPMRALDALRVHRS